MTNQKNLREIVLDVEATGLSCERGDRIVEIACVELMNHIQTGNIYQTYVNPHREMSRGAIEISGITDDFLKDKPLFSEIVGEFLKFTNNSKLIIHNAKFDIGFLNCELKRLNKPLFRMEETIDTLDMARRKFPGAPANLDALCKRFCVDNSKREKHGALIDCYLLADVYINLIGGKQSSLMFSSKKTEAQISNEYEKVYSRRKFSPSSDEMLSHKEFTETIPDSIWKKCYNN
jgi:DNA polymerase-3 subunit epsilon